MVVNRLKLRNSALLQVVRLMMKATFATMENRNAIVFKMQANAILTGINLVHKLACIEQHVIANALYVSHALATFLTLQMLCKM